MSTITRRDFLQTTAAATLVASVPALTSAAQARQDDPFGGFTVGVQSYSYRQFTLERALEQIQMLGLRHVEFYASGKCLFTPAVLVIVNPNRGTP